MRTGCLIAFWVVLAVFCYTLYLFLAGLFAKDETQIMVIVTFVPLVILAGLTFVLGVFAFGIFRKSTDEVEKDKEMKAEIEEKARKIQRKTGEGS